MAKERLPIGVDHATTSVSPTDEGAHVALNLIGESPSFRRFVQRLRRVATSNATVLIQGETGTGKELAARAVHYLSSRGDSPFIPVNCGALPDNLVENELFGHARGAFTDARTARDGVLADAAGGTVFLDEVEALSAKAQVAMLRFLQDGSFRPLGARKAVQVDVRVVAASNIELSQLAKEGAFRADLMYRLRLLTLETPPLRERPGDVPLLACYFVKKLARQYDQPDKFLPSHTLELLQRHSWPGNVRELENLIHRAFLLADEPAIQVHDVELLGHADLPASPVSPFDTFELGFRLAKAKTIERFESAFITHALERCRGNVSAAARLCGKERRAFGRLISKYNIDKLRFIRDEVG